MSRFTCSANRIVQSDSDGQTSILKSSSPRMLSRKSILPPCAATELAVYPCAHLVLIESGVLRLSVPSGHWSVRALDAMWIPAFTFYQLEAECEVALHTVSVPVPFCPGHFPADARPTHTSPLLRELVRHLAKAPDDYDERGHFGRVASLVLETLQWPLVPEIPVPHLEDARLRRIQQALLADPANRRTLQQWSDFTNTSCRTLARLFQKEAGACFCDWRNQLRLSIALPMLAQGEPVTSVAFSVGFESPGTFTSMFRRFMDMSPSQYASLARQGASSVTAPAEEPDADALACNA